MVLPFLGEPSDAVPRVAEPPVDFVRAEFRKAVDEADDDAAFVLGLLAAYRALIVFEGVEQTAFLGIVLAVAFDALPFASLLQTMLPHVEHRMVHASHMCLPHCEQVLQHQHWFPLECLPIWQYVPYHGSSSPSS